MKNMLIITLFALGLIVPTLSFATPGILKMFISNYSETQKSQLADCRTCHMPTVKNNLNSYALSLKEYLLDFRAVEEFDADGDGASNIDEIRMLQLPGSQAQKDEVFIFNNRIGAITFNHEKHSLADPYLSKGKCTNCHDQEDKFPRLFNDKESWQKIAHPICKGCHKESGKENAPKKCFLCHDKTNKKGGLKKAN